MAKWGNGKPDFIWTDGILFGHMAMANGLPIGKFMANGKMVNHLPTHGKWQNNSLFGQKIAILPFCQLANGKWQLFGKAPDKEE
jgi:hypothetical protein